MHTKPKSPVKLSNETDPSKAKRLDTANAYRKDNVNVAQGPRTGNSSAHNGKRADFMMEKQERAPLADVIARAYGERQRKDYAGKNFDNDGSIMPDVAPKRFTR
jgi:hypothetical protein